MTELIGTKFKSILSFVVKKNRHPAMLVHLEANKTDMKNSDIHDSDVDFYRCLQKDMSSKGLSN